MARAASIPQPSSGLSAIRSLAKRQMTSRCSADLRSQGASSLSQITVSRVGARNGRITARRANPPASSAAAEHVEADRVARHARQCPADREIADELDYDKGEGEREAEKAGASDLRAARVVDRQRGGDDDQSRDREQQEARRLEKTVRRDD